MLKQLLDLSADIGKSVIRHKATALTAGAVCGTIITAYTAAKAGYKSANDISNKESEEKRDLTDKEKRDLTWKNYIKPAIAVCCTISAAALSRKYSRDETIAAIATASIYSDKLSTINEKIDEKLGKKKSEDFHRDIETDIENERFRKDENTKLKVFDTGHGDMLCKDKWSGRLFWSDVEFVRQTVNDMNQKFGNYIVDSLDLNDLYEELGLKTCDCGSMVGWDVTSDWISSDYTTIALENGDTITVFDFAPYILNESYN